MGHMINLDKMDENVIECAHRKVVLEIPSFPRVLKQKQRECIIAATKYDTFCVLPTGYGKTAIIQIMPYMNESESAKVLVMCPLNAILSEYINKFGSHCCNVKRYTSDGLAVEDTALEPMPASIKYIIGHPEDFLTGNAVHLLQRAHWKGDVTHIIVDEAHCVSEWGLNFRVMFSQIAVLRSVFPTAFVLALTATATKTMEQEIRTILRMNSSAVSIRESCNRANIVYCVKRRLANIDIETSYETVLLQYINELNVRKHAFPKTVIYMKIKWLGFAHKLAMKILYNCTDPADYPEECMIAQYHASLTSEVSLV